MLESSQNQSSFITMKRGEDYEVTSELVITQEDHETSCENAKTKNPAHLEYSLLIGKYVETRWLEEIERFMVGTQVAQKAKFITVGGSSLHFSEDPINVLRVGDSLRVMLRLADFTSQRGVIRASFYTELWKKRRIMAFGLVHGRGVTKN